MSVLLCGCGSEVAVSQEEVRLNRRAGEVLAPGGINEYFIDGFDGKLWAAWSEVVGDNLSIQLGRVEPEGFDLAASGGKNLGGADCLGPRLALFEDRLHVVALLRRNVGTTYELFLGEFSRELELSREQVVPLEGRLRDYGLLRADGALYLYWLETPGHGFHVHRFSNGQWAEVAGGWIRKRVIGRQAVVSVGDEVVAAWWDGAKVSVSRSDQGESSSLEGLQGQPVLIGKGSERLSLVSILDRDDQLTLRAAVSSDGGRSWQVSGEELRLDGERASCEAVPQEETVLLCNYWDPAEKREVAELIQMDGSGNRVRLEGQSGPPRPRVFNPGFTECGEAGWFFWQERIGKESKVFALPVEALEDVEGSKGQEVVLANGPGETIALPNVVCSDGAASITFFRAPQERRPVPGFGVRGDLIIRRIMVGSKLPEIW